MIKDIGIQGLRTVPIQVGSLPETFDVIDVARAKERFVVDNMLTESESMGLDVVDVTTRGDTERMYLECYTESTGPR